VNIEDIFKEMHDSERITRKHKTKRRIRIYDELIKRDNFIDSFEIRTEIREIEACK
jgi:hypothetical protein